jgi:hypothetical protein
MSMNLLEVIRLQNIAKLSLAMVFTGALLEGALPCKAETPDTFTRHGLPIPGAYFAKKERQKSMTVAVSKSRQGVGEKNRSRAKSEKDILHWLAHLEQKLRVHI